MSNMYCFGNMSFHYLFESSKPLQSWLGDDTIRVTNSVTQCLCHLKGVYQHLPQSNPYTGDTELSTSADIITDTKLDHEKS